MKRVVTDELLDSDSGTPAEISAALSDLRLINRWFGGVGTSLTLVERIAGKSGVKNVSLLEVAAGSGFLPLRVRDRLKSRGIEMNVTLLDRAPSHVNGNGRAIVGDALQLPLTDDSFDIVSSNLFLHHLSPDQTVAFVNEALRVCRVAVLINDLIRSPLHLAMVYAGLPLFRSRITHNDAPASVRQAYTPAELRTFLQRTSAASVDISRHYLYRIGVIAWKH
jgi:ubiquinone/menaquinone biosynthesis C-methylase UbiE